MEKVPFFRPSLGEEEICAASDVIKSGQVAMGPKVEEFEREFGRYIGNTNCVAVSSLTSGYMILLNYLKPMWLKMPSLTYVSMANTPRILGIDIGFRDTVHVGEAYPIFTDMGMIVDSAHQMDRGMCEQISCHWLFSFHATKNITTGGEGGMVVCPDRESCERLKELRDHGSIRGDRSWKYKVNVPGWSARMTDLNAAIGIEQLKKINGFNMMRMMIADSYNELLGEDNTSKHLYTISVKNRDSFIRYMERNGVQCSVHYRTPIHRQPTFRNANINLPHTDSVARRTVSLPLYPDLLEYGTVMRICRLVNRWRKK